MSDWIYAFLLTTLEMTFVFVGLGLLHSQRKNIGSAPFYVSLGLIFLFSQFVCAANLQAALPGGMDYQIGPTVLYLPYLAALLLVYITEGTLAAQRLIIGSLVLFGLYFYLGEITRLQCSWIGFAITSNLSAEALDFLLGESRRSMVALVSAHLLDFFLLPIFFTRLKNANFRLFFSIFGALALTQAADSFLYALILYRGEMPSVSVLSGSLIARFAATLVLSSVLTIYLRKIESEPTNDERSALDICFAFLGAYGRSKMLEASLLEWEDRYRQVLRNASELILLLDGNGRILDANVAAAGVMGAEKPEELQDQNLFDMLSDVTGNPFRPRLPAQFDGDCEGYFPQHFRVLLESRTGTKRFLACSLSLQRIQSRPVLVLIGRDVTEESKLAEEKTKLSEQLAHSQRIESLGQLAGGIAHDFNNHIHAILGHIDVIQYMHRPENPEVIRHLEKIAEIAEQSGKLTGQLLGFARKGKYQIATLDLRVLVDKSLGLLNPQGREGLTVSYQAPSQPFLVQGDMIQLQQVLLNLMLNAIDAMAGREERKLTIVIDCSDQAGLALNPPEELRKNFAPENYCFIKVADTGHGMDADTMSKIFEPFFTTKPVGQGTGMGLPMVYGTVNGHHGWVQVTSKVGSGTAFYVFLPLN